MPVCLVLAEEVWGSPLHVVRSLGLEGVPVLVATAGTGAAVYGRSRFCTAAADFDPSDPAGFCSEVRDWVERLMPGNRPVVVLPLSDRLVSFLHQSREAFPDRFRLSIPPPESTEALLTKEASFRLAERAGLNVPPWVPVRTPEEVTAADVLKLPVVVRPTSWATVGEQYFKLAVCRRRDTLHQELRAFLALGAELVVQEYVEAGEADVELALLWRSTDGHVTAVCTGRKRRQANAEGGVMVWGETIPLPDVRDGAVRFLDAAGFTGLGGIEFIRAQGRPWFIECNPRLEAIHFLAARAGLDTVRMAYCDLAFGEVPRQIPEQQHAAAWMGNAWLQRLLSDPSYRWAALRDRWDFARAPRRVRAVWTWRDPLPSLALGGRLVAHAARSLLRRRPGTRASSMATLSPQTADIP